MILVIKFFVIYDHDKKEKNICRPGLLRDTKVTTIWLYLKEKIHFRIVTKGEPLCGQLYHFLTLEREFRLSFNVKFNILVCFFL